MADEVFEQAAFGQGEGGFLFEVRDTLAAGAIEVFFVEDDGLTVVLKQFECRLFEGIHQHLPGMGFGKVAGDLELHGSPEVRPVGMGGEDDNRDSRIGFSNHFDRFESVEPGHGDIEE